MDVRLCECGWQRPPVSSLHRRVQISYPTIRSNILRFQFLSNVDTNLLNYLYQSSRWMTNDMLRCSNRHRLLATLSILCQAVAPPASGSSISVTAESMAAQISVEPPPPKAKPEKRKWIKLANNINFESIDALFQALIRLREWEWEWGSEWQTGADSVTKRKFIAAFNLHPNNVKRSGKLWLHLQVRRWTKQSLLRTYRNAVNCKYCIYVERGACVKIQIEHFHPKLCVLMTPHRTSNHS